jgi:hypothetical protein
MAVLTIQQLQTPITWSNATITGDSFSNTGEEHLMCWNTSGGDLRVRFEAQTQPTDPFISAPDLDVTITAGTIAICKAVPPKWFNDGTGRVQVTYLDGVTNLAVAAVSIPAAQRY